MPLINNRYHQIVDKAQRILFVQSKDINWEEFLGHKHENMTRRYIDCIQRHVDRSSEQYYKEQKSLVSEWKEGSGKDGN